MELAMLFVAVWQGILSIGSLFFCKQGKSFLHLLTATCGASGYGNRKFAQEAADIFLVG
jgi:hypothetical protein